jgi:hypothetical protein
MPNKLPHPGRAGAPKKPASPGRKGFPVSLAPLTPEQAISGIFQISPADVKRIVASKPGNRKKKG